MLSYRIPQGTNQRPRRLGLRVAPARPAALALSAAPAHLRTQQSLRTHAAQL